MSIRNAIYYNGIWLDTVKLKQHAMEPMYSGQNYVHTKHTLSVSALVSNEAEVKYVRSRTVAFGEMRNPYTNIGVAPVTQPIGLLAAGTIGSAIEGDFVRRYDAGDAAFMGGDLHKPLWDVQSVRHHLLQPRGVLVYYLNNELILACPQYPTAALLTDTGRIRSVDAYNGPIPQHAVVTQLSSNALLVDFSIVCYLNESHAFQSKNRIFFVSSHSYFVDVDIDTHGYETRVQSGVVNFKADLLKLSNLCPDDFREFFAPPIPFGFKREHYAIKVDANNTVMQYKALDREVNYTIDRSKRPDEVWVADSFNKVLGPVFQPGGMIDRSKIMRMQASQSRHNSHFGAAVPLHFVLGPVTLPHIVERLSVMIYGNNFASRYELERVAYYVMLVRLPLLLGCVTFEHEIKHDLVGSYVELHVTRTYPAGFQMVADLIDKLKIFPNLWAADATATKAAGQGGGNLVFYPCADRSIVGTQNIENVTVSAACSTDTGRDLRDPFNPANWDVAKAQITHNQIGLTPDGEARFIHEYNRKYRTSVPVMMPGNTRSRGTAGVVGIVHTNLLTDIADKVDLFGTGDDSSIKRLNTDYRHRDPLKPSSAVLNDGFGSSNLRSFVDQHGIKQNYLNNPFLAVELFASPGTPYSYFYQINA